MNWGQQQINPAQAAAGLRDGVRDLNELRKALGQAKDVESAQMSKDIERLLEEIRNLDPNAVTRDAALLTERIKTQVLPALEHLELSLRRQVDDSAKGQVRTPTAEKIPAGYGDAVAEYFRKLSKGK